MAVTLSVACFARHVSTCTQAASYLSACMLLDGTILQQASNILRKQLRLRNRLA